MSLINTPPIRVKKYPKGYSVEIQKQTWYGRKYWVHVFCYMGMPNIPFYFATADRAISNFTREARWKIISESLKSKYGYEAI